MHGTIRACSIWRALETVGDVPVLLILEQCFLGTKSFDGFVDATGLPRSVVAERLKALVAADCLLRTPRAGAQRGGYRLTEKGRQLFPVALMMLRWQHRWSSGDRGFRVALHHETCGKTCEPTPDCEACGTEIDPRAVQWREGPGLAQVTPVYRRRRSVSVALEGGRRSAMLADPVIRIFGDRWATLVVRALFTGIHRFDEIRRDAGMATNILAGRIEMLVDQGIVRRTPYSDHADRFEYRLTAKGRDIYPILLALLKWGDAWYADERGPPLLLTHAACGAPLELLAACSECGKPMDLAQVRMTVEQMSAGG